MRLDPRSFIPPFGAVILVVLGLTEVSFAQTILFVRGGAGTGGFLEGGADEQLSDITDNSTQGNNHGWGQLADLLEGDGYVLEQMIEGPIGNNTPVDLAGLDLSEYAAIVLGSNNAEYPVESVDAIEAFVRGGGGLLVISDANWGTNWGDAPTSDQPFLDRFGLIMNQDTSTYALCRADGDFVVDGVDNGTHPILDGVQCFDGEGVSPVTLGVPPVGVISAVFAGAEGNIHVNDAAGSGSFRAPTDDDGALVVARADDGRIACHFDRNTFFNQNGAGTDITRFDNATYASNLFRWLTNQCPADLDADSTVTFADVLQLIGAWGPCAVCVEDLDGSGSVDFADILVMIGEWGRCG